MVSNLEGKCGVINQGLFTLKTLSELDVKAAHEIGLGTVCRPIKWLVGIIGRRSGVASRPSPAGMCCVSSAECGAEPDSLNSPLSGQAALFTLIAETLKPVNNMLCQSGRDALCRVCNVEVPPQPVGRDAARPYQASFPFLFLSADQPNLEPNAFLTAYCEAPDRGTRYSLRGFAANEIHPATRILIHHESHRH